MTAGRTRAGCLLFVAGALGWSPPAQAGPALPPLVEELAAQCTFSTTGSNPYFVLQPGWTLELAGVEDDGTKVTVTAASW